VRARGFCRWTPPSTLSDATAQIFWGAPSRATRTHVVGGPVPFDAARSSTSGKKLDPTRTPRRNRPSGSESQRLAFSEGTKRPISSLLLSRGGRILTDGLSLPRRETGSLRRPGVTDRAADPGPSRVRRWATVGRARLGSGSVVAEPCYRRTMPTRLRDSGLGVRRQVPGPLVAGRVIDRIARSPPTLSASAATSPPDRRPDHRHYGAGLARDHRRFAG
jgi:hypothetical protein